MSKGTGGILGMHWERNLVHMMGIGGEAEDMDICISSRTLYENGGS